MSKLEKVAIRYRQRTGKPLVLVFNNVHFLKDDDVGDGILHLIQQRAESWAASQCANMLVSTPHMEGLGHDLWFLLRRQHLQL